MISARRFSCRVIFARRVSIPANRAAGESCDAARRAEGAAEAAALQGQAEGRAACARRRSAQTDRGGARAEGTQGERHVTPDTVANCTDPSSHSVTSRDAGYIHRSSIFHTFISNPLVFNP